MPTFKSKYKAEICAWRNAIHRCQNPKNTQYADYGGRGITVDPSFTGPDGFETFFKEIGPKPSPELTLDRISNDKGYEPGNLAWKSRKHQVANRRERRAQVSDLGWGFKYNTIINSNGSKRTFKSPLVPLGDRMMSIQEWSEELGINTRTLRQRFKRGATPEQALLPVLFNPHGTPRKPPTELVEKLDLTIALLDQAITTLASRLPDA